MTTRKTDVGALLSAVPKGLIIPPQPKILNELQIEANRASTNVHKIAKLVSHDVAIASAVLKVVNSPYFGLTNKVQSVSHAVSLLGIEATRNMVASLLLRSEFEKRNVGFPRFWDSASNIADLCAYLARKLGLEAPELAFTLGLFHDVGIPLMAQQFPDYLDTLKGANAAEQGLFTDVEQANYQVDHAIVGCVVTIEWGISEALRDIILYHHDFADFIHFDKSPEKEFSRLLAVLKVAELGNSYLRGADTDSDWIRFGPQVTGFLGRTEDQLYDLIIGFQELGANPE